MKNFKIGYVVSALAGFSIFFVLPAGIKALLEAIQVKGVNTVYQNDAIPPCYTNNTFTTLFTVFEKTGGDAINGLAGSEIVVQQVLPGGELQTVVNGNTDNQGNAQFLNFRLGEQFAKHRVMVINPLKTDTTVVNVRTCSGVEEIKIPVRP
ncbi:MAG: hypothetical protein U0T84_09035 [Chitinophagales bacterium]